MWRGSLTFETPMLWAHRLPRDVPLRRPDRDHPRVAAAGLPPVGQLLRGRALPLRGLRHRRVRGVRRLLLLVAEADRADAERAARARSTSGRRSSGSTRRSSSSTGSVSRACRAGTPTTCPRTGSRPTTGSPPSAPSSSASRCWCSSTTSGSPARHPKVAGGRPLGLRGARWSGRRRCPPPRHNFIVAARGSAPSGPPSTCTIRRRLPPGSPRPTTACWPGSAAARSSSTRARSRRDDGA